MSQFLQTPNEIMGLDNSHLWPSTLQNIGETTGFTFFLMDACIGNNARSVLPLSPPKK